MARTLRAAVFSGFFVRRSDGRYENNRMSRALLDADDTTQGLRASTSAENRNRTGTRGPTSARPSATGKNAFDLASTGGACGDWFDAHPDEREMFARGMMSLTILEAAGVATTYPFGEFQKICDVGGGRGTLLSEILLHHPSLQAMLVPMPPRCIDSARSLLKVRGVEDHASSWRGRPASSRRSRRARRPTCSRNVLHDWDDARSSKILADLPRPRRSPRRQRLVVVEQLVEEDCDHHGTMVDLHMMTVCGEGRERGRADFARLFEAGSFRVGRVLVTPTGMGIIEGIAI